VIYQLPNSIFT